MSTGSQLTELEIPSGASDLVHSLALAPNCKFIATSASRAISFLDTSTLAQTGPAIEDSSRYVRSIAISHDNSYLATGQADGTIIVRNLSQILPDLYGPFDVSICAFMVPHVGQDIEKLCSYLLLKYKTNNLRHQMATVTNHLTLIP